MFVASHRIRYSSKTYKFRLRPLGDIHLGAAGCDEEALNKDVEMIAADKDCYTILMGDMLDCITPNDKRWDVKDIAPWLATNSKALANVLNAEKDRFLKIISPIKDRVLAVIEGNHEKKVRKENKGDLPAEIARTLGVDYLGGQGFIKIHFERMPGRAVSDLLIFAAHGFGGGRKSGSKVNNIEDLASFIDGTDIICMGHNHARFGWKKPRLGVNNADKFIARERAFLLTGTYLKTYEEGTNGYGAESLYPPTSIGSVLATFKPWNRELETLT